jgi:hypothetical protein
MGNGAWGDDGAEQVRGRGKLSQGLSPMPNAQCPMPNAQCPIVKNVMFFAVGVAVGDRFAKLYQGAPN